MPTARGHKIRIGQAVQIADWIADRADQKSAPYTATQYTERLCGATYGGVFSESSIWVRLIRQR